MEAIFNFGLVVGILAASLIFLGFGFGMGRALVYVVIGKFRTPRTHQVRFQALKPQTKANERLERKRLERRIERNRN